jgi:ribosomal protein S17E
MSSIKRLPLPSGFTLFDKRPELFCLDYNTTKRECDEYNRLSEVHNQEIWDKFKQDFERWKSSN